MIRRFLCLAACCALAGSGLLAGEPPLPAGPTASALPHGPYLDPNLRPLMEAVTFRLSFDANSLRPDMAAGADYEPRLLKSWVEGIERPRFADGLFGRALVLGTGRGQYVSAGTAPLATRGAVALWVRPENWRRDGGGNVTFFGGGSGLLVQRQGPGDGKRKRHERLFTHGRADPNNRFGSIGHSVPEYGRWCLIVSNWAWPEYAMSVNGGALRMKSLAATPDADMFRSFVVGSGGGQRALLDEVLIFRRPLAPKEIALLWRLRPPAPCVSAPASDD